LALNQAAALERPDEISSLLVQGGTPPTELLVEQEELEDYFLRLVGANGDK
jgi:ABC-2 type transport system ATP-binding protein